MPPTIPVFILLSLLLLLLSKLLPALLAFVSIPIIGVGRSFAFIIVVVPIFVVSRLSVFFPNLSMIPVIASASILIIFVSIISFPFLIISIFNLRLLFGSLIWYLLRFFPPALFSLRLRADA